jgi:hypothetical protein
MLQDYFFRFFSQLVGRKRSSIVTRLGPNLISSSFQGEVRNGVSKNKCRGIKVMRPHLNPPLGGEEIIAINNVLI